MDETGGRNKRQRWKKVIGSEEGDAIGKQTELNLFTWQKIARRVAPGLRWFKFSGFAGYSTKAALLESPVLLVKGLGARAEIPA